jgi:hypothetical protein
MTHWKKLRNNDYLGAYAIEPNQEPILTIKSVGKEMVTGDGGKKDECIVAHFTNAGVKPMILNATNCKTITKIYGTPQIEEWIGKPIQIFVAMVNIAGEPVEALRIRPAKPVTQKPDLNPKHPKWDGAIKAIAERTNTIEGLREYVSISEANKTLLVDLAAKYREDKDA